MHNLIVAISLAIALVCASTTAAQDVAKSPLGTQCPLWNDLPGTDGNTHSSTELSGNAATLVVFLCNHCPCSKSYESRFIDFSDKYQQQGVKVVAFNSDPNETLPEMQKRANESHFNFTYLRDEEQRVAKALGAKTTPHVFLLDKNQKVVFSGAFDDDKSGKAVKNQFIVNAVEELLAGKAITVSESRLCGCAIAYE